MSIRTFTARLLALTPGQDLAVDWDDCNTLFAPGLNSEDGRQQMYTFANTLQCDVRWNGAAVHFVKR